MLVDANDLIQHEGHRLAVKLDGPEDTHVALVCEDEDDEVIAEETAGED